MNKTLITLGSILALTLTTSTTFSAEIRGQGKRSWHCLRFWGH